MTTGSTPFERARKLRALSDKVQVLELALTNMEDAKLKKPKWSWGSKAIALAQELQQLAADEDNIELIQGPLNRLLEWPEKRYSDPKLFYGGKEGFETFNRNENWFDEMDFAKHSTQYTFSNRWDKKKISATFLVPNAIEPGAKVPIMWFFHGGGFCTGASDHIPWYSKASLEHARRRGAVVIAPEYPLGPEANYKDIVDAIRDFLLFYKEDGWFGDDEEGWASWLLKKINKPGTTLDKGRVFVEGESAGGHAVVTALFLNAEIETDFKLEVKAALLRYPMLRHYTRSFPIDGNSVLYMGESITKDVAEYQTRKIYAAIMDLERVGLVPTTIKRYAPQGMAAAFLLSITKKWKWMFQRKHYRAEKQALEVQNLESNDSDNMDCLERAKIQAQKVSYTHLPPILMYHGHDDTNCPFEDTEKFKDLLTSHYPGRYRENETVFLWKVTALCKKPEWNKDTKKIEFKSTDQVGHGFDYDLSEGSEGFLREVYEKVDSFWMTN